MSLTEEVYFDKSGRIESFPWIRKLFLAMVIILVAGLSFGIGRLTGGRGEEGIRVEYDQQLTTYDQTASAIQTYKLQNLQTSVVASKNGKKYHYSYCSGAKQIAEANKITFPTREAAEASGYTLASNCQMR
jgi:hypothetical protein